MHASEEDALGGPRRSGRMLTVLGTFAIPLSQWIIFWLLARFQGAASAGSLASMLAVATPVFVILSGGMRNLYLTLETPVPFRSYLIIRLLSVSIGSTIVLVYGCLAGFGFGLVTAIVGMKAADAITDLFYAPVQRSGNFGVLGCSMILNGVVTCIAGATATALIRGAGAVVAASTLGSLSSLAFILLLSRSRPNGHAGCVERGAIICVMKAAAQLGAAQGLFSMLASVPIWAAGATGSLSAVGAFSGSAYLLTAGNLVGAALQTVRLADYRLIQERSGPFALHARISKDCLWVLIFGLCVVGALLFAGDSIFETIYGVGFGLGRFAIVVLGVSALLSPVSYLLNSGLMVENRYSSQAAAAATGVLGAFSGYLLVWSRALDPILGATISALLGSVARLGVSGWYFKRAD